jgi:hypothetical protein
VGEPSDVYVALQRDAGDVAVVGVFRSFDEAAVALGWQPGAWQETTPGRWTDGQGLRVERHALV